MVHLLETNNILVNKLSLNIRTSPEAHERRNISEIIKSMIYSRICDCLHTHIDWHTFIWGGTFSSEDGNVNGIAASAGKPDNLAVWAASVYHKDRYMSRRRWKYFFGIRQHSDCELTLSYAKCYNDHMAGSINAPKPLYLSRDQLPDIFFNAPEIQCMCGKRVYPTLALELNAATLPEFIDCLQDESRTMPMILITCADYIYPEPLMDQMMGNAVIYWCDDAYLITRLNALLPDNMKTPWDSVHIFIPIAFPAAYHPVYPYSEIYQMGKDAFIAGLIQAHCRSMHHEERKAFLTVDDVNRIRNQEYISSLLRQQSSQSAEIADLKARLEEKTLAAQAFSDELGQLKAKPFDAVIAEYEELLTDSMAETDNLKRGVSALSERLYSTMGIGFKPDASEPVALLQELSQAIYSALACASSRKQS